MAPKPSDMTRPRATPSHSARSMSSGSRLVAVAELGGEARAALAQHLERPRRSRPPTGSPGSLAGARGLEQPRQVGAEHDRDRRGLRRRADGRVGVVARARREPQPGHLAVVAQPVEPRRVVAAHPARRAARAPTRPRRPRSPAAARARRAGPPRRRAGVPGATCCQRSRKRMKSCAVAGSDPAAAGAPRVASACGPAAGATTHSVSTAPVACSGPAARSPRARARPARRPRARRRAWSASTSSSTVVMPRDLEVTAQRPRRSPPRRRRTRGAASSRAFGRAPELGAVGARAPRPRPRAGELVEQLAATRSRARATTSERQQVVQVVGRRRARA